VPTEPDAWRDEPRSTRRPGAFGSSPPERPGSLPSERPGSLPSERPGSLPSERPGSSPSDPPGSLPSERPGRSPRGAAQPPHRRGFGTTAALVAAIFGAIGLVVSLTGLAIQLLPRHFSAAQQRQIMAWEVSKRWRTLPAGDIFPASVHYDLSAQDLSDVSDVSLQAPRVGIAPQTSCDAATDPAAARVLNSRGCQAVLRATYTDESATYVITVGVAVLGSAGQASAAATTLNQASKAGTIPAPPGLESAAFAGTPAGSFGNGERQLTASKAAGPYVIMYAAGYADGRPQVSIGEDAYAKGEMTTAAQAVQDSVASTLATPPPTPHCPGTPGC
jgi:hypothetical protein